MDELKLGTDFPIGKGLFICAACSATIEDFYFLVGYEMMRCERCESSFDFQDGVKRDNFDGTNLTLANWERKVVDVCCGKCLVRHKKQRKEEWENCILKIMPDSFWASEIRRKRKKTLKASAKKQAKSDA